MGMSLLHTGYIEQARAHYDRGVALYNLAEHRPLATRFGQDIRVAILCYRSWTQWILGYPDLGLADANRALKDAREIGQAATLMYALYLTLLFHTICRNFVPASTLADELIALADEKGAQLWKALGVLNQGCVLALTGKASDAVARLTAGMAAFRATGATVWVPWYQSYLAGACAEGGQFDDAWDHLDEAMTAMEKTNLKWCEAEVNRIAGEITLMSPEPEAAKAQAYFERALSGARQQRAKSWELRASMSLARLWRDQGKVQQARELLAPVYGWFTEGFRPIHEVTANFAPDEFEQVADIVSRWPDRFPPGTPLIVEIEPAPKTTTVIQTDTNSFGSTSLTEVANQYFYLDGSGGSGPALQYAGANVTAGEFGGWTSIGAAQTTSGYEVAWKVAGADEYTVWTTDSHGNYSGSLIGAVSGNSAGSSTGGRLSWSIKS